MADFNFPSNPNPGDTHTVGSNTWSWNGSAWIKVSSSTKVFSSITATERIVITTTTNAISTSTGALIVRGGVGIGGDLYVGGTFYGVGGLVLTTSTFGGQLNEGPDIKIDSNTGSGVLTFSNISTLQSVTSRGSTTTNKITITNTSESTSTTTGALLVSGGIGVGGNIWANGRVNSESLKIEDSVFDSSALTLNTTATVVVDSYSINQFRSSKYFIQISKGTGSTATFQMIEISLLVDNVGTVYATEYGLLTSNGELGYFAADLQIDNLVRLYYTSYSTQTTTLKVLRTAMSV